MGIRIEVLAKEEDIEREFLESLEKRQLEEKFFYWFPLSVRAWINLCHSKEYKNYSRSYRLSQRISEQVADTIGGQNICWISLGCGDGSKEIVFLRSLKKRNPAVRLKAVDFSLSLLELSCSKAQAEGIEVLGYKADITNPHHFKELSQELNSTTKIYSILGNTLGAFEHKELLLNQIAQQMNPGDYFLVDGEIYSEQATSAGYLNPVNKRFAIAPLYSAGLEDEDGELVLVLEPDPRKKGHYRIRKQFQFVRERTLYLSGVRLIYKKGEVIRMSYSYKYDQDAFMALLAKPAGWTIVGTYLSDDKDYLFALCRKSV